MANLVRLPAVRSPTHTRTRALTQKCGEALVGWGHGALTGFTAVNAEILIRDGTKTEVYANTWYDSGVEGKKADPIIRFKDGVRQEDGPTWYGDWASLILLTSAVCCAAPSYKGTFGCCTGFPDDETPKKTLL